jgi:hypothetical protein
MKESLGGQAQEPQAAKQDRMDEEGQENEPGAQPASCAPPYLPASLADLA